MLSKKGSLKPVPFTLNRVKIPTVPLPVPLNEMINVDAILVTHIHMHHFDNEAKKVLAKDIPIFCKPNDWKKFNHAGCRKIIYSR
jgi:L-ascorbate metabolism protein UlaG (beta-lactamase superfamily)